MAPSTTGRSPSGAVDDPLIPGVYYTAIQGDAPLQANMPWTPSKRFRVESPGRESGPGRPRRSATSASNVRVGERSGPGVLGLRSQRRLRSPQFRSRCRAGCWCWRMAASPPATRAVERQPPVDREHPHQGTRAVPASPEASSGSPTCSRAARPAACAGRPAAGRRGRRGGYSAGRCRRRTSKKCARSMTRRGTTKALTNIDPTSSGPRRTTGGAGGRGGRGPEGAAGESTWDDYELIPANCATRVSK